MLVVWRSNGGFWLSAEVRGAELGRPLDPRKQTRRWRPLFVGTRMPFDDDDHVAPHRWERRVGAWTGRDRPFGDGDTPHPGDPRPATIDTPRGRGRAMERDARARHGTRCGGGTG